jgi:hypothetical protein
MLFHTDDWGVPRGMGDCSNYRGSGSFPEPGEIFFGMEGEGVSFVCGDIREILTSYFRFVEKERRHPLCRVIRVRGLG